MTSVNALIGQLDQNDEVFFFFFKPMSLLIYYNSNEQPSNPFPTDLFKALQIAFWTIL
jgi:hypothetical protein